MDLLQIIVLAIIALALLVALIWVVLGGSQWADNISKPVRSAPASVLAKRTETNGLMIGHGGYVATDCFVTFESRSGQRMEFELEGEEYGKLLEGDEGVLTYQGMRYHGFDRKPKSH